REGLPARAHIMDDLLLELQQPITITESGRSRMISKQQALRMTILQQAMMGKRYAWKLFWSMFTHFALDQEPDKYLRAFRDDPDSPAMQQFARELDESLKSFQRSRADKLNVRPVFRSEPT